MKKRLISLVLILAMLCSILPPMEVQAADYEGTVTYQKTFDEGNVSFTVYDKTLLVISGDGPTQDYFSNTILRLRFGDDYKLITDVIIEEGITSIGEYLFYQMPGIKTVDIAASVTTISKGAFFLCSALETVSFREGLQVIENAAFMSDRALTKADLPDSVTSIGMNAFANCTSLPVLFIPKGVTSIGQAACSDAQFIMVDGENAYYNSDGHGVLYDKAMTTLIQYPGNSGEESYTIPVGVTTIAENAFNGASYPKELILPEGLETIENYAFRSSKINAINIPSTVRQMGEDVFRTSAIKSFTVAEDNTLYSAKDGVLYSKDGKTLISYPPGLIYNTTDTADVVIPEGVTTIGEDAFYSGGRLVSLSLPSTLQRIEANAFENCWSLPKVEIPAAVTYIGSQAFYSCNKIQSVTFNGTVETFGDQAFYECEVLDAAYFKGLPPKNFGTEVFDGSASGFTIYYYEGEEGWTNPWNGYTTSAMERTDRGTCGENVTWQLGTDGTLTISGTGPMYDFYPASYEPENTALQRQPNPFGNIRGSIRKVVVEEGVTTIGAFAFESCSQLGEISLPASVAAIHVGAFTSCISLTELVIPATVKTVEKGAFQYCSNLYTLEIKAGGVTALSDEVFDGCTSLKNVTLPSGLKTIGARAFSGSQRLEEMVIPQGVTSLGAGAFSGCTALETVSIPASLQIIGLGDTVAGCFAGCTDLRSFSVASGNSYYSSDSLGVLYNKDKSTLLSYPGGRKNTSYTTADGVITIGEKAFQNAQKLKFVRLADSVTTIGNSAFAYCQQLQSVILGNNVTDIDRMAFQGCESMETVTIPASVQILSYQSFANCSKLYAAYFKGNCPPVMGQDVFVGCAEGFTIYYEDGATGFDDSGLGDNNYVPVSEYQDPVESDRTKYYSVQPDRTFRLYKREYDASCPQSFTVNVGGTVYKSQYADTEIVSYQSSCDVKATIPEDYTGSVTISAPGFRSYSLDVGLTDAFNKLQVYPTSYTGICSPGILYNPGYTRTSLPNLFYEGVGVKELDGQSEPESILVHPIIEWNGHGEGVCWLKQGERTIPLTANTYNSITPANSFVKGQTIYLCAQAADGTYFSQATKMTVVASRSNSPTVDMGDDMSADTSESDQGETEFLGDETLVITADFLERLPITITHYDDGIVEGVVGVKLLKGSVSRETYNDLYEVLQVFESAIAEKKDPSLATEKLMDEFTSVSEILKQPAAFTVDGSAQFIGCFKGTMDHKGLDFKEFKMAFLVNGEIKYVYNTVIWVVPAYVAVRLGGEVKTYLPLRYDGEANALVVDQQTDLEMQLTFGTEIGAGSKGLISGGIEGVGYARMYSTLPMKAENTSLTMEVDFDLVGTIKGLEGRWTIVDCLDETIFWKNGEFCWTPKNARNTKNASVTETLDTSRHNQIQTMAETGTIVTGISGYNPVDLVRLSDGRLLAVWVADDSQRATADKNAVYYSIYSEETGWTAAQQVSGDGTLDSNPDLHQNGDEIYLTWEDHTGTYGETIPDPESTTLDADISVARFSEESDSFVLRGKLHGQGYDSLARMDFSQGTAALAWQGEDQNTYLASWDGSGWIAGNAEDADWYKPEETALPGDYTGDAVASDADVCVTSSVVGDAIFYGAADEIGVQNIYGIFEDADGWGKPVALTTTPEGCTTGDFAALMDEYGVTILRVVRSYDEDGSMTASLELLTEEPREDLAIRYVDYVRDTLTPGGDMTLKVKVENKGSVAGNGFVITVKNGDEVLHTQQLGLKLSSGEEQLVKVNVPMPETLNFGELTVEVMPNGVDGDPSNNVAVCPLYLWDLAIEDGAAESSAETGTRVTAQIVNRGYRQVSIASVTVYEDCSEGEYLASDVVMELNPGDVATVDFQIDKVLSEGQTVYVRVTPYGDEALITNNELLMTVTELEGSGEDGEDTHICEEHVDHVGGSEPTCTDPGLTDGSVCSVCGAVLVEQEYLPPNGHSYDAAVTEPTCTKQGYTTYTCSVCGHSYTGTYVESTGHSYDSGKITVKAGYLSPGEKTFTCQICGHSYTQEVARLTVPFTDVEKGKFYYTPMLWALDNGITTGTTKTTFEPDGDCTRAQVVTFLWRAAGKPKPGITEHPFTDVDAKAFYYKAMLWAVENGITTGTSGTTFSPSDTCTRDQVVTFLWRASGKPAATSTSHNFTDVRAGAFYYKAMLWAVENKITLGVSKTTFKPKDICTRGQVVTFLYRAFG